MNTLLEIMAVPATCLAIGVIGLAIKNILYPDFAGALLDARLALMLAGTII